MRETNCDTPKELLIIYYLEYLFFINFDNNVKMNVMDYYYYYWIIKILRGNINEVVVKRVFVDPQGEMTNGERYWVKTQVM